jgi:hypothetical protein
MHLPVGAQASLRAGRPPDGDVDRAASEVRLSLLTEIKESPALPGFFVWGGSAPSALQTPRGILGTREANGDLGLFSFGLFWAVWGAGVLGFLSAGRRGPFGQCLHL